MMSPRTIGGLMATPSQDGFSFAMKSVVDKSDTGRCGRSLVLIAW